MNTDTFQSLPASVSVCVCVCVHGCTKNVCAVTACAVFDDRVLCTHNPGFKGVVWVQFQKVSVKGHVVVTSNHLFPLGGVQRS